MVTTFHPKYVAPNSQSPRRVQDQFRMLEINNFEMVMPANQHFPICPAINLARLSTSSHV
jgi:hypothetical protein